LVSAARPTPSGIEQVAYQPGTVPTAAPPSGLPPRVQRVEPPHAVMPGNPSVPGMVTGAAPGPLVQGPVHTGAPAVLAAPPMGGPVPTELAMRSLPPYRVEPPDILLLDTIRLIPKGPYTVSALDTLLVRVADTLPNQPIDGVYVVSPEGVINLGYSYGAVRVGGLTLEQVEAALRNQLSKTIERPKIGVSLAQYRGVQQVRGTHLVRPDGTIHLGGYGCVYVAGLSLNEIKVAVERHLSQYVDDPEISVDVLGYNSKVYYVIYDGAGYGQTVVRLPITGKDTVLDAISQVQGLSQVASKKHIWVARPAPAQHACLQVLPVDWRAITEGGATNTNYQLFPGDRIYVGSDPLIRTDNFLAKLLAPVERVLGVTLLGTAVVQNFRGGVGGGGANTAFIAPIR
jgi:polysaccharide export outer membrane protein